MKNQLIVAVLAIASLAAAACAPAETNTRPAITTSSSASGGASAGALDGRTFAASSAKLPDGSQYATELSFAGGTLTSSACTRLGFAPGRYTATRNGDVVTFRAEMKKGDEVEVWTGRITGDVIDAQATAPNGQALAWNGRMAK